MSFHDMKLTRAEKKLMAAAFRLDKIVRIVYPLNDDGGIALVALTHKDMEAIRYAHAALVRMITEAEEAEEERKKS